jgi:hypothetical protein
MMIGLPSNVELTEDSEAPKRDERKAVLDVILSDVSTNPRKVYDVTRG